MGMNIRDTMFDKVKIITPTVYEDHRGFFKESYHKERLQLPTVFVQDNLSKSVERGTLRGIHFQQSPKAQAKLLQVICGEIFDVVVDLRKGSPTYGKWQGFYLSDKNHQQIFVPRGFGHGFCTLVVNTVVSYKVDEYYSPEHDSGIRWDDPTFSIDWPIEHPILSEKDGKLAYFQEEKEYFLYERENG